jgi:O-antigen ligase
MIMWLGIFALYPVRGTLFNLVSGISTQNRYAWNFIFSNPNDLATLTLPMLAMVIVFLPLERGWTRWAARIGAVLLPAIVVATQSRAGILALGVMVTGFILNARRGSAPRRRRVRSHRLAYLTIATLAAIGIAVAAPQGVWERLKGLRGLTGTENLQQVDVEGSAEQRFEIWRVSWAIAADHPFFGVGPGIYPVAHANYASRSEFKPIARGQRDTHSMYFNALAEGGLPALALLLGMISSVFTGLARGITRADPAWPEHVGTLRVLGIGFIGFLVASAFATMQHIAFLYLYIAVITSAVALGPPAAAKPARPFPQPRRSR